MLIAQPLQPRTRIGDKIFSINVDISELAGIVDLDDSIKGTMQAANAAMAQMIRSKAIEIANQKLHSRRKMYVDALSIKEDGDDTVVSLDKSVVWIENGMAEHNMLEDLLKSPKAKRAKDGSSYIIIPFDHSPGQGPANTGDAQMDIMAAVKSELKKRGIPFSKIEKDGNGMPKVGRLHSFDITKAPLKNVDGPGMGKGPIGAVRQGNSGVPFLQGVSVYQGNDKKGKIKRSILTFRTASSNQKGKWDHPGVTAIPILDSATEWAFKEFDKEIGPAIFSKLLDI